MTYLIIGIILSLLIYHYDYQNHKKGRTEFYFFVLVIFVCIAGLRYRIGIDSVGYEYSYPTLPDIAGLGNFDYTSTRFGIGYIFLNSIARSISDQFVTMQFLHAIFINSALFYFFYKNCKHIFTCIFFYYIFLYTNYNFEILRESCAVAIFVLSWPYLCRRAWIKYYLCAILAILFHSSAAITLLVPLIFLPGINKLFQINIVTPFVFIGLYVIGQIIAVKFFDWIRLLDIASMDSYANTYENSGYAEGRNLNIVGIMAFCISTLFYPCFLGWLIKTKRLKVNIANFHILIGLVILFIYISILKLNLFILYRFLNYLYPFLVLFFGDVIFANLKIFKKKIKFSFGIWVIFLSPTIIISLTQYNQDTDVVGVKKYSRYYPYETIIFKDTDPQREALYNNANYIH